MDERRDSTEPARDSASAADPPVLRVGTAREFALFDTAVGRCGIAWSRRGVAGVQLPEGRERDTRARLLRRFPGSREAPPPAEVRQAIAGIVALLRGDGPDLGDIDLDMDGVPPFHRRVYEVARTIPPGSTLSYGEVAARAGEPGSARTVGEALGSNPFALVVPCHRVLAAGGKMGGFSAHGGVATKRRLLAIEGWRLDQPDLFDGDDPAMLPGRSDPVALPRPGHRGGVHG